ncbi:antibiotic biosynthesis monooxygenase family protein [Microbacterium trichothecenolyticum]|uniref:Antibiotic biosynthesis monooxygenase family protein n=1 Tax=Microbacterium psychrotolerans TaxID=3068321 RepID=A0ABU0YXN9_9MICO|nr:antibiotic biosynthesis monooxygenase family protein [Microbacterium sp. QXD-8]MDQ7877090.1 antibiotic biosynthesis monooxygenase family protein [Microbacterium sp. QXD-8]
MTVLSVFVVRLDPDLLGEAPALIRKTLEGTRAQPGCLGVEVSVDVDDPTRFVLVERWATIADDEAYRSWRSTPAGVPPLASLVVSAPTLTRAEVLDHL